MKSLNRNLQIAVEIFKHKFDAVLPDGGHYLTVMDLNFLRVLRMYKKYLNKIITEQEMKSYNFI